MVDQDNRKGKRRRLEGVVISMYGKETLEFLELLDPQAGRVFTFQTFDDSHDPNTGKPDPKLAVIIHAEVDTVLEKRLRNLNKNGAGIFVSVNETDGKGRKKENITRVRAMQLDLDGQPLPETWPLEPHIIVELSPGRYHVYWRVDGMPLDQYEGVQRAIAKHHDGDPKVAMLTTCARLPGFMHQKDYPTYKPFHTKLLEWSERETAYAAAEILSTYPPIANPHKASTSMLVLDPQDPLSTAIEFIVRFYRPADAPKGVLGLVSHRGDLYRWNGGHYVRESTNSFEHRLYGFLQTAWTLKTTGANPGLVPFKPTKTKIANIIHALESVTYKDDKKEPPFDLVGDEAPRGMLPCRNGMLNISDRTLTPHTPAVFNTNILDFDYDPDAPEPERWLEFIEELWPDDDKSRAVLQEILGYLISVDTRQQKAFLFVGPRRSGKGTINRVLTGIVGKDNVAFPTFSSLASQFGMAPLIGRTVATISDARLGQRTNVSVVVERLLSISGEDDQTADRKYKDHWTGRIGVRFLILTNELPRLTDARLRSCLG